MPLPRASLRSFLSAAKSTLTDSLQHGSPITFVIGNESADVDSLCSAVILAYFRTYTSSSKSKTVYIPLSNIPRADLALRTELIPALNQANLKISDLITLSDLPPLNKLASKLPPEKTRWMLVDYNSMEGELGEIYGKRLIGCIDHHVEENVVPKDCGDEPRVVTKSGSCMTLVVQYCKDAWDALSKPENKENAAWNSELARMALGSILIDTTNLTREMTPADVDMVKYLESWVKIDPDAKYDRDEYFHEISEAKQNIGSLSVPEIIRKDYKQWTEEGSLNVGISSIMKGLEFLIEKAGSEEKFLEVMKDFAKERNLSVLSLMTKTDVDGQFKRGLFVWAIDEKGVTAAKKFGIDSKETLGLEQWHGGSLDFDGEKEWRRCWWQERIENSRKQVAPLLRTALAEVD